MISVIRFVVTQNHVMKGIIILVIVRSLLTDIDQGKDIDQRNKGDFLW